MSNPVPNNLALSVINTNDTAQSAPLRNNYAAIQTAVNQLIACLSGGTAGQRLQAVDGTDVQWVNQITYRKTSAKQVVNTVAETDLLNGEITVGAGALGTTGVLRLTAWGDWVQNGGSSQANPRLKAKLGGTTIFDTNVNAGSVAVSATRFPWRVAFELMNLGATNSQLASLGIELGLTATVSDLSTAFTTGEGIFEYSNTGAATQTILRARGFNTTAIDTTVSQALALTVINPIASAGVDVTLKGALVEIV